MQTLSHRHRDGLIHWASNGSQRLLNNLEILLSVLRFVFCQVPFRGQTLMESVSITRVLGWYISTDLQLPGRNREFRPWLRDGEYEL